MEKNMFLSYEAPVVEVVEVEVEKGFATSPYGTSNNMEPGIGNV